MQDTGTAAVDEDLVVAISTLCVCSVVTAVRWSIVIWRLAC